MNCLSFIAVTSEQKRPDTEVVQSNGHSLSLSFGAASECGREGRLPPLSLGSPEAQRGRATLRGVRSEAGVTAPSSGGLQGFGRSPRLARTQKPSPANAEDTRLYICSISEKARLGAGSVLTAAVPDGGGGLGSSASSQRCLHMQSLSECAMSFLLGSAASFTVDWFLFRSRGCCKYLCCEIKFSVISK
ncbi:uncharacterized protein [Anser cygnoides]|uniref:uncharacterized protein isoform X2 n=1 Tax=Anser cygnoides TaxID=8845 RepID=UPI0034D1A5D6